MKHASRMLLIPEDLYLRLKSSTSSSGADSLHPDYQAIPEQQTIDSDRKALASIAAINDKNDNDYARHIHYTQRYKEMQKLIGDRNERPLRVTFASPLPASVHTQKHSVPSPTPKNIATFTPFSSTPQSNRRRRRRQRPANAGLADGSSTAAESEYADANDDEQQQEHEVDSAELEASPSFLAPNDADKEEEEEDVVQQYVRQNAVSLGIDPQGRILNQQSGLPLSTSNIARVIKYAQKRRDHGLPAWPLTPTGLNIRGSKSVPIGYVRFMQIARAHPFLREQFNIAPSASSSSASSDSRRITRNAGQKGKGSCAKVAYIGRAHVHRAYNNNTKQKLPFKPELW